MNHDTVDEATARDPVDRPLAKYEGAIPPRPIWFAKAMACMPESKFLQVEGTPIEYLEWGESGRPGIILLHGGRAHAHWWASLAPLLAADRKVVAFSFSGMGRSGWRESYSIAQYAREAKAVADASGLFETGNPWIVGHSFGAGPAAACLTAGWARGGIVVDSAINLRPGFRTRHFAPVARRRFWSIDEALSRFHLLPAQPCSNDFMVDQIARLSLRKEGNEWEWCYDPDWLTRTELSNTREDLHRSHCPIAFIHGDRSSLVTEDVAASLREEFPQAPLVAVPDAAHHVMLDQPLALVATIRALIEVAALAAMRGMNKPVRDWA